MALSREIGGEYQLSEFPGYDRVPWPARRSFFASGRAALAAVWRRWVETHLNARLWLPEYFCSEVVSSLALRDIPILRYPDDPQRSWPEFSQLRIAPGDMV